MHASIIPTRLVLVLFVIALAFSFIFAQDEDLEAWEKEVPPPKPGIATVKGKVIYDDTGRPLRYGVVGLKAVDGDYESDFVRTDSEGNYEIRKVPAGTFHPFVKTAGVLNPETLDDYPAFEGADPPVLEFQKIEITGPGEYRIDLKAKRGGTLSGTVKFADGEVGGGLKVKAILLTGPKSSDKTIEIAGEVLATTDGGGFYRITGLLPGDYIVGVAEPVPHKYETIPSGLEYFDDLSPIDSLVNTFAPGVDKAVDSETIRLLPGGERTGVNITIRERRLFNVAGKVVEKGSGRPLTGISVEFRPIREFPEFVTGNGGSDAMMQASTRIYTSEANDTENDGKWELRNLPKGNYMVTFSHIASSRYFEYEQTEPESDFFPTITKEIQIVDSNLSDVVVEIPRGAMVSGLVATSDGSDLPAEIALVISDESRENWKLLVPREPPTDAGIPAGAKVFRAFGMAEGSYKIYGDFYDHYIQSVSVAGRDITNNPIKVVAGEELTSLVVILGTDAGKVAGRINDYVKDPAAVFDGVVFVRESGEGNFYERASFEAANPDGTFEASLRPGIYRYILWKFIEKDESLEQIDRRLAAELAGAHTITVKARETVNLTIDFRK